MIRFSVGLLKVEASPHHSNPPPPLRLYHPSSSSISLPSKQGAIILGIGGDNSNNAIGTFYEGAMTAGYSSDETDAAVQANIVAAGYGK